MIKLRTIFYALLTMAILSSCGDSSSSSEPIDTNATAGAANEVAPKPQATVVVSNMEQLLDSNYNERTAVVEGYLTLPTFMMIGKEKLSMDFYPRKNQGNGWKISADIRVGSGNNTMNELKEKYNAEDFVVRDDKGGLVKENERVKITGTITAYPSETEGQRISIEVLKIEKVEEVILDYSKLNAVKLTKQNFGQDSLDEKLVYVDGVIAFDGYTMMTSSSGDRYIMDLSGNPLKEDVSLYILVGNGPNQMAEVPDNFTPKDIKVYDKNGKPVGSKKVRIYGSYNKVSERGILDVEQIVVL